MVERFICTYNIWHVKGIWLMLDMSFLPTIKSFCRRSKALIFCRLCLDWFERRLFYGVLSWRRQRWFEIELFSMLGDIFATTIIHNRIEKCPYSAWFEIGCLLTPSISKLTFNLVISWTSKTHFRRICESFYLIFCPNCSFWVYFLLAQDIVITRAGIILNQFYNLVILWVQ